MIPNTARPFDGIYPSTVLPMHADFSPDWDAYARHTADCVLRPGMAGVLMNGHAGENFVMSRAEKRRAVEVAVTTVGATRIVVAGVNAEGSLDAAAEARDARDAGADAIMVFLPNGFALAHTGPSPTRCPACRCSCSPPTTPPAAWLFARRCLPRCSTCLRWSA